MATKIPIYVIILVIIFILVFIVILASIGSNNKSVEKAPYYKKKIVKELTNQILIESYPIKNESDSFVITIDSIASNEAYIFGGPMQNSSVSVYKKVLNEPSSEDEENLIQESLNKDSLESYVLLSSNVYSEHQGFAVTSNSAIVNGCYYQIGKKIPMENTKYNYIPLQEGDTNIKIVINNILYEDFEIYKCKFNYEIPIKNTSKALGKTLVTPFGLSEYDLEVKAKDEAKLLNKVLGKRVHLQRSFQNKVLKKNNGRIWKFNGIGSYIVFYVKGKYSFSIQDSYNNLNVENTRDSTLSLQYFIVQDPRLEIYNYDENIPIKNFHKDIGNLMNMPVTLYNHFVNGKKREKIDIWNRIHNKILIFKLEN
jgi:hypothetical protein